MRNLHQNAGTVTGLVACLGTAVLHIFKHLKGIVHQFVALSPVNIHHHSDTTRIVFISFAV